ncbi:MAG: pilus assembly protein [Rhodopseudomonas sp.]|uniref:TadE/TadG family type IV pilus assembly protein n=1 Tax=Rhodopseudomonas sp. TaxID=1078 RepID=UPI0018486DFA|nr:TadE/TadG family type IV pilus assembly protein [Rhodopseudomonas sp.]NVN87625.1 pilus assembly protein [Rhodopseudomonas sp.]
MKTLSGMWPRLFRCGVQLIDDRSGLAATEFAFIVPLMLVMFFGTVELSSGIAVDRKVTLVARTLSDLTSQSTSVMDNDLKNFFTASYGILSPYSATPTQATISEVYINSSNVAKIQWSKAATVSQGGSTVTATLTTSSHSAGDTVTIPSSLAVAGTYLIWSEVSYLYTPAVGYVMGSAGVTLTDRSFTRPRQTTNVPYCTSTSSCTP